MLFKEQLQFLQCIVLLKKRLYVPKKLSHYDLQHSTLDIELSIIIFVNKLKVKALLLSGHELACITAFGAIQGQCYRQSSFHHPSGLYSCKTLLPCLCVVILKLSATLLKSIEMITVSPLSYLSPTP
jgi:hypothetical protein